MANTVNSILINEVDNVATAIVDLHQGDSGRYLAQSGIVEILILESIPRYHKFAVRAIRKDEVVRKYGEAIGQAIHDIGAGAHVHIHNIVGPTRQAL